MTASTERRRFFGPRSPPTETLLAEAPLDILAPAKSSSAISSSAPLHCADMEPAAEGYAVDGAANDNSPLGRVSGFTAASADTVVVGAAATGLVPSGSGLRVRLRAQRQYWSQQQNLPPAWGEPMTIWRLGRHQRGDGRVGTDSNGSQGSAYVFTRSGTSWSQQQN